MAFGAEVDEGGFEAGFDASDAAFVDVGLLLLAGARLDVEVEQALAVDQCNTQLLGLSRVDQHSFHVVPMVSGATGNGDRHTRLSRSVLGRVFRNGGPFRVQRRSALGAGPRLRLLLPVFQKHLSQEEESAVGGGRKCVWIKLEATQSNSRTSPPYMFLKNRAPLAVSGAGWHLALTEVVAAHVSRLWFRVVSGLEIFVFPLKRLCRTA